MRVAFLPLLPTSSAVASLLRVVRCVLHCLYAALFSPALRRRAASLVRHVPHFKVLLENLLGLLRDATSLRLAHLSFLSRVPLLLVLLALLEKALLQHLLEAFVYLLVLRVLHVLLLRLLARVIVRHIRLIYVISRSDRAGDDLPLRLRAVGIELRLDRVLQRHRKVERLLALLVVVHEVSFEQWSEPGQVVFLQLHDSLIVSELPALQPVFDLSFALPQIISNPVGLRFGRVGCGKRTCPLRRGVHSSCRVLE